MEPFNPFSGLGCYITQTPLHSLIHFQFHDFFIKIRKYIMNRTMFKDIKVLFGEFDN